MKQSLLAAALCMVFWSCNKSDENIVDVRTHGERGDSEESAGVSPKQRSAAVLKSAVRNQADIVMGQIMDGDSAAIDKWNSLESNTFALNLYTPTRPSAASDGSSRPAGALTVSTTASTV